MSYVKDTESVVKNIFLRIKNKNFSGSTGIAVKNSIYNFSKTAAAKFGSLIFTIIIARLLMPELFGLYSLALSTILIFAAFSELGINQALVRFVSKSLGKNKKSKAESYIGYIWKVQSILLFVSVFLIILLSKFISETYYQKPLFLALLAGMAFIIFVRVASFLTSILQAFNNFKGTFIQEIIFQISRVILIPLAVVYSLKFSLSNELTLFYIILFLSIAYLISSIYLFFESKKEISLNSKKNKTSISKKDKKIINKFIFLTAAIILSGTFFGNIDRIMLGFFVSGEFIGYYTAAFSLVGALSVFGMFGAALLPVFSRLNKKKLNSLMGKATKATFVFSIIIFLAAFLFAYPAILIIFGEEYLFATNILKLLSVLILILPIISIYITYFMSENKPGIVTYSIITATIINIILNYILITSLLPYGELRAVYGAAIATILSQFSYLGMLVWKRK